MRAFSALILASAAVLPSLAIPVGVPQILVATNSVSGSAVSPSSDTASNLVAVSPSSGAEVPSSDLAAGTTAVSPAALVPGSYGGRGPVILPRQGATLHPVSFIPVHALPPKTDNDTDTVSNDDVGQVITARSGRTSAKFILPRQARSSPESRSQHMIYMFRDDGSVAEVPIPNGTI